MAVLLDILAAGVVDTSGLTLSSGVVYVYQVGTTTKVAVYSDVGLTNPVSNPVTLDAAGKAEVYTENSVRLVIESSLGAAIADIESVGVSSTVGEFTSDFLPDVSDTHDIGSASKRVAEIHTNDLYVYDDAFIELLSRVGATNPGWINNLSIELQAGVFKVVGIDGTVLSSENPGYVSVPSTTAGRTQILKVTSGGSFNDDSHASSDLTNTGFGITETVDWASDMPFFLYVINRGNTDIDGADGSSVFAIARNFSMKTTPSAANSIGDTGGGPVTDDQDSIIILADVTVANYVSLPCQMIGAFRMQWVTSTDDWTVQTLGNGDGLGATQIQKTFATRWAFPAGQNGAVSGRFMLLNGATTVPQWSTQTYFYNILPNGNLWISVVLEGDGGTDGGGIGIAAQLAVPYMINTDHAQNIVIGIARVTGSGVAENGNHARAADGELFLTFSSVGGASGTTLDSEDFGNGTRSFKLSGVYPSYVS